MTNLKLKDWKEVIDMDFPSKPITAATVNRAREYQGQVRRPYSNKEYEERRERVAREFNRL